MKNIVILISGSGSNMAAIVRTAQQEDWARRYGARVAAVLSNKTDAAGLVFARAEGIATEALDHKAFESREAFDMALAQAIDRHQPALVVLAGFMRILTPGFVARYAGRLVNIHPSLLPAFTGLNTHQRAIDAGCKVAGVTVHQVTDDTLAARVQAQEHVIYPRAVRAFVAALS
jgi:phosphoribosylglycinamide formyltransferase-1